MQVFILDWQHVFTVRKMGNSTETLVVQDTRTKVSRTCSDLPPYYTFSRMGAIEP
jgi:hypothetical protein